jgi:ribonuclease-3
VARQAPSSRQAPKGGKGQERSRATPLKRSPRVERPAAALVRALGHEFSDPGLLGEALTHRSAAGTEGHPFGYERLEFLGDRVLGLVIADLLLETFPDEPEGAIALRFAGLVRRETLERVADAIRIGRHIRVSENEERVGGKENRGIQADVCEAVIGALYLDGGFEVARRFVFRHWGSLIGDLGHARPDAKTALQEWTQARGLPLPVYRVVGREGPAHRPYFTVEVEIAGEGRAPGAAPSKRSAEQAAAAGLLGKLDPKYGRRGDD